MTSPDGYKPYSVAGRSGLHAEGHDATRLGRGRPSRRAATKAKYPDHVIGGKRQHHGVAVAGLRKGGPGRDRRPGIRRIGSSSTIGLASDFGSLLPSTMKRVGGVGDDDRDAGTACIRHRRIVS